jgi:uncharacterized membrane protein (DUF485 family)
MLSLEQLGIEVHWNFKIVSSRYPVEAMAGTIFCDLGGSLSSGIIDPHGRGYLSSADAVAAMPHLVLNHLLGPLNQAYHSGQKIIRKEIEFTFAVSRSHWDGLCCFVLCDYLVRTGRLPSWYYKMVESANLVDHGKIVLRDDQSTAPLLLFYALNAEHKDNPSAVFPAGLELLNNIGAFYWKTKEKTGNPFFEALPSDPSLEKFEEFGQRNINDLEIFEKDLLNSEEFEVFLPRKDANTLKVEENKAKCLMFLSPPKCRLFVHWSRSKYNYDLLVVPSVDKQSGRIDRWTISVDPASHFHLYRLGYRLEQEEKKRRLESQEVEYRWTPRGGEPRWGDRNYSDNADPWYDGRDHEYTLVDSPRSKTILSEPEEIKDILLSRFYGVTLKGRETSMISKPRFFSYLFFEIDSIENISEKLILGPSPFENLSHAFTYVKNIRFHHPEEKDIRHPDAHLSDYRLNLYVSDVTKHAILEIESVKDTESGILEDIPNFVDAFGKDAVEIGKWFEEKYGLKSEVWGRMSFSLLLFMDPDLNFHDEEKLRQLLRDLTNYPVSIEDVRSLKNRPKGDDVISSSASVCVLRQSANLKLDEDRRLIALYALFIKTAYRRFSQRLEPLTENEDPADTLDQILQIQKDFSRFLASYDFSGTEISLDGEVTNFFNSMSKSLAMEEQKQETNVEMQLIGNLASSFQSREEDKRARNLSISIIFLSLIAMCDFLYAFSRDFLAEPVEKWLPRLGITLIIPICLIGIILPLVKGRKAKKRHTRS